MVWIVVILVVIGVIAAMIMLRRSRMGELAGEQASSLESGERARRANSYEEDFRIELADRGNHLQHHWDDTWTATIADLRSRGDANSEWLARYIVTRRRELGLPELSGR